MIIPLVKVTVCGLLRDKARILADLQKMGCLHLIPLAPKTGKGQVGGPTSRAREALKFLLFYPQRRRQVRDCSYFDAKALEDQVLDLQRQIRELGDERDFLRGRIRDLKPWGEFDFPPLEEIAGVRLWFYVVPHYEMPKVEATGHTYEVVRRDNRFSYVIVLVEEEPGDMPVVRTRTGNRSPAELERRLESVELELEDLQAERASLTRWIYLFSRSLDRLEDEATIVRAADQTLSEAPLFALQAWAPRENLPELQRYATGVGLVFEAQEPEPGDSPPTLLRNQPALASGQDLVSFYTTPGYWLWDPSNIVFISFTLFFAMILADAGYGLLLGLGLLVSWRRMGQTDKGRRFRILLATMFGATIIYGVLVNSYFGVAAPPDSFMYRFKLLDLNDFSTMMGLSVAVGVIHLIMGNAADAWSRRHSASALAPLGWIAIFVGAVAWGLTALEAGFPGVLATVGQVLMGLGGAAVLFFTEVSGSFGQRLLGGLKGLSRISGAFGDTLSYLRLFALGLASASLAINFNALAKQVYVALPGLGLLFAILIIIVGHGLNLVLAVASGFIHGLRLNFIEFFNWSLSGEGYSFQAFARKEKT